ncbi:MAG: VCBS repeat-containing protein [Moorea sp. SIOASIH]|uniref:FG-GAP repeat domain-containing protein n=1 Tax=Moorena sp. SIOASIH TaxID=2607817 RepID=UPI0013B827EA|nr:VCBS repeat-containing protein [Moorena sp. SIOASIH]NEO39141.1 VCBS repeat-containing protein [Moorena sp. SIOASIH]
MTTWVRRISTIICTITLAFTLMAKPAQAYSDIALVRQAPGWGSIPVASSNGDGSFTVTNAGISNFIDKWAPTGGVKVITGDFNGNGRTDIALVRQAPGWGSIPVAFSEGDGSFTVTNAGISNFIDKWAPTGGVKVITGDFNADGRTDIALVRQAPGWGSIPVAFSNGDGSFNVTNAGITNFIDKWAPTGGVKVLTGDFNGDSRTDIALVRQAPGWGSIPVAFSNGDGSFNVTNAGITNFIDKWAPTGGVKVITGDFNGNGRTDIALVRQAPGWGSIPVAFSNGDGSFTVTNAGISNFIDQWAPTGGVKVITGDFNGNGRTDIALVRQAPGWGSIPVAFSNGDGSFTVTNAGISNFIDQWAPAGGVKVITGNFNCDGRTDIALVRQAPGWGSIPVAFSNGDGSFTVTNAGISNFIDQWAPAGGVKVITADFGVR